MFNLESVAHNLANKLSEDIQIDTVQKAKVEYGLSLMLGVASELILTVGVSFFFGTAIITFLIMLSALALRLFTGGAHCSSFRRCSVFTMVVFIGASLLVKAMINNANYKYLIWFSLILILVSLYLIWKPKLHAFAVWIICAVFVVWCMLYLYQVNWLIKLTLSMVVGLVLQAFMVSPLGQKFVLGSDKIMIRLSI